MSVYEQILIEQQYWGSVSYYALLLRYPQIIFDQHEHFRKGSYRNRCNIMGPNGLLSLSIPLVKGKFQHTPMGKVKISHAENWRKDHWMSLVSSYRRSAYFEYYEEEIAPIYNDSFDSLKDLNLATFETVCRLLQIKPQYVFSKSYLSVEAGIFDARSATHPNVQKQSLSFHLPEYPQVFMDRMPFMKDLSILDLLFNLGPRAKGYLEALDLEV